MTVEPTQLLDTTTQGANAPADGRRELGREHHQAWLKELERAQVRHAAETKPETHRPQVPTPAPEPREAPLRTPAARPPMPAAPTSDRAPASPAGRGTSTPSAAPHPTPAGGAPRGLEPALTAVVAPPRASAVPLALRGGEIAPAAIAAALAERLRWEPRHIHAIEQDGEVCVWLRDTAIGADDDATLLASVLRATRALGLRLAGLTVNGRVLAWRDADPTA